MAETYWKLNATVLAEANGFTDVVNAVHWECFARETEGENTGEVRLYGAIDLPLPVAADSYIDLSAIRGADEDQRRAIILGWASMLQPGFVESTEAVALQRLQAQSASPDPQVLTLI